MAANLRIQVKRVASGKKPKPYPPHMGEVTETDPLMGSHHRQPEDQSIWTRYSKHIVHITREILFHNWVNVLLVFVPLGIIAGAVNWPPIAVFALNFLAIIPLASLLSFATEELAAKLGQTIGGLLNATFGNAVELIVSIVALKNNEIRIVQASMLGSILSNSLLVLGCCFLFGGYGRKGQSFNTTVASTMSSLMAVASTSLVIPATLYGVLNTSKSSDTEQQIRLLSHGTAIILLVLYVMYLYFQLHSHASLFDAPDEASHNNADIESGNANHSQDHSQKEEPLLTPWTAAMVLVLITIAVSICAEYLVDSINAVVATVHISKTFIGLILIPIVGNAAEHVTAVIVARKNKMDLAIGVAIGSSLQIALGVTPFLVILGWIIDRHMTLHFQMFETVVLFLSVIVVNYLIQDGESKDRKSVV